MRLMSQAWKLGRGRVLRASCSINARSQQQQRGHFDVIIGRTKQLSPGSFIGASGCPWSWPRSLLSLQVDYSCQRVSVGRTFFTTGPTTNKMAQGEPVKTFQRLSKSVVPVHYDITIKPDLVKLVFEGTEEISLKVLSNIPTYVLLLKRMT